MKELIKMRREHSVYSKGQETVNIFSQYERIIIDLLKNEFETEFNGVKTKHNMFNELELSRRIVGYEAMTKIRNYAKKNPEIRIVGCDDSVHASSMIVLIPHPTMGITMMFIPQCTGVQNEMFLYPNHYKMLLDTLNEMRDTYKGSYFEDELEEINE